MSRRVFTKAIKEDIQPDSEFAPHRRAIAKNDLNALKKIAYRKRSICDKSVFDDAIMLGNLKIVKYLHKNSGVRYSDQYCFMRAISKNHIDIIKYFIDMWFTVDAEVMKEVYLSGNMAIIELFSDKISMSTGTMKYLVRSGNLETISYFLDKGCPYGFEALKNAIRGSRIDIIALLHQEGKYVADDIDDEDLDIYGYASNLEMLAYLHEIMGVKWTDDSLMMIILEGNQDMVKYALEHNIPIVNDVVVNMLEDINDDYIRLFYESGRQLPSNITRSKHMMEHVYKYYHDNVFDKSLCKRDCYMCTEIKVEIIREKWVMEISEFHSFIQWLPAEVLDEVIDFC